MSGTGSNDPKSVQDTADIKEESKGDDEELDALLDDALEGFDKPLQVPKTKDNVKAEAAAPTDQVSDVVWSEEFIQEASLEFEKNIRLMMAETAPGASGDSGFAESLLKVSQEAAAKVFERQPDQGASFADTLRYLAEGTESLQTEADEATLAKMLEKMAFGPDGGFGDGAGGDMGGLGDILPAMQGMLQSLLSKELLYPSIKEIVSKYPDWLADNRPKLEPAQFEKYNRQYAVMQQVCTEFENDNDTDDAATKNSRFEKILTLMQQMQECGHPPKELAGEAELLPNPFGGADFAQSMGPGAENCVVM
ncbi:peroxisomal biogenesis factor 19-like [Daphnia pulex]|uniref:peroxisomal biogenesis factor 19-like n=1 Tax=Daphnia pulex TaxID=6669 RepID=UPI001EDFC57E|nr:peroxisomal biogenesis factor 19-like [Daphnia pulex]